MYTIAHISDLHIQSDGTLVAPTIFQRLTRKLGIVNVVADRANQHKIAALRNTLRLLKPDMLVVSGDLTNFGDTASLTEARDVIAGLFKDSGAKKIVIVPGNHDTLCDRATALQQSPRWKQFLVKQLAKLNPEVHTALRLKPVPAPPLKASCFSRLRVKHLPAPLAPQQLSAAAPAVSAPTRARANGNPYTASYAKTIEPAFGPSSPDNPVIDTAPWGTVAVFPFDSTSDYLLLCNEGAIAPGQFNEANRRLDTPEGEEEDVKGALKIAVLHHHPVSAPIDEHMGDRAFNSMRNGGFALRYFNRKEFRLVLHGHQHSAFCATLKYDAASEIHIAAAGTACAGETQQSSFNLIEVISPHQAVIRRYDYEQDGFASDLMKARVVELQPIDEIRISAGPQDRPEDIAIRTLMRGDPRAIDLDHEYSLLAYAIKIKGDRYCATYRRAGRVRTNPNVLDKGVPFFIVGAPDMETRNMNLNSPQNLHIATEIDEPRRKMFRVLHGTPQANGATFDVTLCFEWQCDAVDGVDVDGINLGLFRHPVERIEYSTLLPWRPRQFSVKRFGSPPAQEPVATPTQHGNSWLCAFEIDHPQRTSYLIEYRK